MNPNNTISQSPSDPVFLKCETKSLNTLVMSIMVIEAINLVEELASMKATLKRLSKTMQKRMPKSSIKMNRSLTWERSWKSNHLKLPTKAHKARNPTRSQTIAKNLI